MSLEAILSRIAGGESVSQTELLPFICLEDRDGKTALQLAIQGNHDDVVRVLKQAGANE